MPAEDSIAGIRLRGVRVPLRRKLVAKLITVGQAPFLLIDLTTRSGLCGRAYLQANSTGDLPPLAALLRACADEIIGRPLAPRTLHAALLRRFGLYDGAEGWLLGAVAGLDMACWDALARLHDTPLAILLGGDCSPLPAYNSAGLGLLEPAALVDEAQSMLAEGGFTALKMRLGRADPRADLAALRALRGALPDHVHLMADATQGFDAVEAPHRLGALDDAGLTWIEDPLACRDLAGHARLARMLRTPIQTGENFDSPRMLAEAIRLEACDCVNLDIRHIGGVTGWLAAAPLAACANLPLSSHMYPEFSAHVLAASASRHWLEHMDWAAPMLLDPPRVIDGRFHFSPAPGAGLEWDEAALRLLGAADLA